MLTVCKCMAALTSFFCDAGLVGNRSHSSGLVANKSLEPAEKSDVKRKSHNLHLMSGPALSVVVHRSGVQRHRKPVVMR